MGRSKVEEDRLKLEHFLQSCPQLSVTKGEKHGHQCKKD